MIEMCIVWSISFFSPPRSCVDFSLSHKTVTACLISLSNVFFSFSFFLGETGNILESSPDNHIESPGGHSSDQEFDYEENEYDSDWYYNPGKSPEKEGNLNWF